MTETSSTPGIPFGQKLRYGAEAAVFFAFMALFRVIGLETASRLGGWIGRNLFSLLPPDRVARANLAAAFPGPRGSVRPTTRMSQPGWRAGAASMVPPP